MIAEAAEPLPAFDDPAFGRLFDRFADRRVVLLGEASHGTREFYRARAAITRQLIEQHGFTIVAVEADWPDAAAVDRYVRHRPARAAPSRRSSAFPPGCGATPTWRRSSTGCATHNDRHAEAQRRAGVLRPRHLQHVRLDRGRARLSRQGRSRSRRGRARALRLPDAVAEGAGDLRPRGAHRRLSQNARRP